MKDRIIEVLEDLNEHTLFECGLSAGNYESIITTLGEQVHYIDDVPCLMVEDMRHGVIYLALVPLSFYHGLISSHLEDV